MSKKFEEIVTKAVKNGYTDGTEEMQSLKTTAAKVKYVIGSTADHITIFSHPFLRAFYGSKEMVLDSKGKIVPAKKGDQDTESWRLHVAKQLEAKDPIAYAYKNLKS